MLPDVDYDGEIAEGYERGRSLSTEALRTWRPAVRPFIPSTGGIVDVGAGTGRFARPLSELARRTVVAVEPAKGMRRSRTDSGADVAWVAGTAEALPIAADSTSLAWTAFTTHYFELERAALEMARILRPGGRVLIWHAFPDVFDGLEWFRWFPTARAIDEKRMPTATAVQRAFESVELVFEGRSDHGMQITPDLFSLVDRLGHRSISTLRLIPDHEFDHGLKRLRAAAANQEGGEPVIAPNVMLRFHKPA